MELSENDKTTLKQTVELLWAQGVKHPNAAVVGVNFTQLVERLTAPAPKEPMLKNNKEGETDGGK